MEKVPSRSWGTSRFSVPPWCAEPPRLVSVTPPGAPLDALVRGGAQALGHLGLQDLLVRPLHELTQEAGIVQPLYHGIDPLGKVSSYVLE